ncbi:hypothetical protein [Mycolicibacterium sp.]|uniref:hypothetical protein n=1 Tax=Mycolicibacterium sp. TaxID=2320850 RepID=UPI0037C55F27
MLAVHTGRRHGMFVTFTVLRAVPFTEISQRLVVLAIAAVAWSLAVGAVLHLLLKIGGWRRTSY